MRNCFVPKCDNQCKGLPKRMMFLPPKEMYELWKEKLPKKRVFKINDKVCERHFRKEDIITTFDHVINGQLLQMERGRPKLKRTAVPCLHLPTEDDQNHLRAKRNRQQRITVTIKSCEEREQSSTNVFDKEKKNAKNSDKDSESENISEDKNSTVVIHLEDESKEDNTAFDTLYEDIFEVVLPDTLWGIHRDPCREFIAFSCFDIKSLQSRKCVVLNRNGTLKISFNNKLVNEQDFETEPTHEFISNLLSEVDETAICLKANEPGNRHCEVIALSNDGLCMKCSSM